MDDLVGDEPADEPLEVRTHIPSPGPPTWVGANGTWVTLYYQDMGYSLCCRAAGFLPPGNA
jgi:hypothetical protein